MHAPQPAKGEEGSAQAAAGDANAEAGLALESRDANGARGELCSGKGRMEQEEDGARGPRVMRAIEG